jgi:hypothetical protein
MGNKDTKLKEFQDKRIQGIVLDLRHSASGQSSRGFFGLESLGFYFIVVQMGFGIVLRVGDLFELTSKPTGKYQKIYFGGGGGGGNKKF